MKVPFLDLRQQTAALRPSLDAALARVLDRGRFILDAEVCEFEREFAVACRARHAITCGNGTQAIELALRACRIGPGDEVILPALTAPFSAHAIVASGATPVFADVDPSTLLLDPGDIAHRLTARTRAILPVHLYGRACDLEAIGHLARKHGLEIIQDACQAHGLLCQRRPLADWSRAVAFSFYPTKNLGGLGDSGAIVTNDDSLAAELRLLRNGWLGERIDRPAINSRMDELQAAILRAKLPYLDEWNANRFRLAARYAESLPPAGGIPADPASHVFHLYVVRHSPRAALQAHLDDSGIGHAVHYPFALHLQPAFGGPASFGSLPNAESACHEILSLPLHPFLTDDEVSSVLLALRKFSSPERAKQI